MWWQEKNRRGFRIKIPFMFSSLKKILFQSLHKSMKGGILISSTRKLRPEKWWNLYKRSKPDLGSQSYFISYYLCYLKKVTQSFQTSWATSWQLLIWHPWEWNIPLLRTTFIIVPMCLKINKQTAKLFCNPFILPFKNKNKSFLMGGILLTHFKEDKWQVKLKSTWWKRCPEMMEQK